MNPQFSTIYALAHEREAEIRKESHGPRHDAAAPARERGPVAALLRRVAGRLVAAPRYTGANEQPRRQRLPL
jgi:hypothetical protein